MPINCYVGLMGSGKSFECVRSVIVPAILKGRNVVTNVDGINGDLIREYCINQFEADSDKLGLVRHCKNDDVAKADFLPHGTDAETFVKSGEMVCIDEAWRFWGVGKKILDQHAIFFREHRHYVDPDTKVSCDLVLMVQDINDIHRMLKYVVEITFKTTKIKSLGLNKTYRVEMWEGYKLTNSARLSVEVKKYDPKIFPLYSSYTGGKGVELQVDKRQNVLASKKLWMLIIGFFIFGSTGVYFTWRIFNGGLSTKSDSEFSDKSTTKLQANEKSAQKPVLSESDYSEKWRYVGQFKNRDGIIMAVVSDQSGRVRIESPSVFTGAGHIAVGEVDHKKVTIWTGELANNQERKP